jgi:limonene-1,2-epoxide hydrolase
MAAANPSPLELVKSFLSTMMNKDYDAGLKLVSDDCEYTNVPLSTVRGPGGIRAVLEPFFAPTIENEFVVKHAVADGPVVFLERIDRHHLATGWVELPVNGVFEVRDGRIALWRDYFDAATILKAWPAT